jgi:hypothetical protein
VADADELPLLCWNEFHQSNHVICLRYSEDLQPR